MRTIRDLIRRKRDKAVVEHLAREVFEPQPDGETKSPTTESGLPVERQVRKKWDPKKNGGLPTFLPRHERT